MPVFPFRLPTLCTALLAFAFTALRAQSGDSTAFWREQAALIDWETPFGPVCDYSRPPFAKWFVGGRTNLCHNAVDRHAAQRPDAPALIWVSTEVDQEVVYSFAQLRDEVQRMAAILLDLGVKQGDRVLVYMPMTAEAAFTMLACTRFSNNSFFTRKFSQ